MRHWRRVVARMSESGNLHHAQFRDSGSVEVRVHQLAQNPVHGARKDSENGIVPPGAEVSRNPIRTRFQIEAKIPYRLLLGSKAKFVSSKPLLARQCSAEVKNLESFGPKPLDRAPHDQIVAAQFLKPGITRAEFI